MVESVAYYGCEIWLLMWKEQRKLLVLEMDYLRRSARVSRLQKIPNTAIRNKMQNNQFWTEFKEGNWSGMDTTLEWKIVVAKEDLPVDTAR